MSEGGQGADEGECLTPNVCSDRVMRTVVLPSFDGRGVLPPTADGGPYPCGMDELRSRFVDGLGSPSWRQRLMDGWTSLANVVWDDCPSSRWWIWGPFVSATQLPRFGDQETLPALVFLPIGELVVAPEHRQGVILHALQAAIDLYAVNAGWVYEFQDGDPQVADTTNSVESKWRPRARHSPIDDDSVPVGFIEVRR